jgi:hypothetical protein
VRWLLAAWARFYALKYDRVEFLKRVVYSPDDTRLGEVNDLTMTTRGGSKASSSALTAQKNVALKLERFKVTPGPDGRARVMLSAEKEELERAPDFKFKERYEQTSNSWATLCRSPPPTIARPYYAWPAMRSR